MPDATYQILLADDSDLSRDLVVMLLRRCGYGVTAVVDGQLAVDAMAQGAFDAVILDVRMPVLDGPTAARHMRAAGVTVPLIALTGGLSEGGDDEEEAALRVFDVVLTKPIDRAKLDETIKTLIIQKSGS